MRAVPPAPRRGTPRPDVPAPRAGTRPPRPPPPPRARPRRDLLVSEMDRAGVDAAVIVQPKNHGFDHAYVTEVLRRHPSRFVGVLLADPADDGRGVAQLEELVTEGGFRGARFNPYIWPAGPDGVQRMTTAAGRALFRRAGELGVPVGFMCFQGLLLHADEIEELMRESPATPVVLDHAGFCDADRPGDPAWARLLSLARYPQVHVKVSALFRLTGAGYPYLPVRAKVRELADAYGAPRLLWGSDWPWVGAACGYGGARAGLRDMDAAGGGGLFSDDEWEWVMGRTAAKLFGLPGPGGQAGAAPPDAGP